MKLANRIAVVTGGGRGIGRAIALAYAAEGASVCVTARSTDEIKQVAKEVEAAGAEAMAVPCDVTERSQVEAMFEEVEKRFGRIDILVNNAGGAFERTLIGEDDPDNWKFIIDLNLTSTYYCCRAALPLLKVNGGSIINVGSGMGHQPRRTNSSYNAAKAGVWMLTRCLSMEVWEHGIAVNELIPGPVYTELTKAVFEPKKPHPSIDSDWVKLPEEVAPLAVFLATQGAKGPTGQSFSLARRPI